MKKWKVIAPLALTAAGALAAGIAVLLTKTDDSAPAGEKAAPAAKPIDPARLKTGSYSFISGYKDAATVEMRVSYDGEAFSYTVVEDEFLAESSDSHVALLYGEDFNLQFEYAPFFGGEDFAAHRVSLSEKHADLQEAAFGENRGLSYLAGDNVCIHLPIPGDAYSYVLVTVPKNAAFDGDVTEIPALPAFRQILESVTFSRT